MTSFLKKEMIWKRCEKIVKNEISEFVSKSIEQVQSGLPNDCVLNGNFDFDISLTTKLKEGKIDIYLAGIGGSTRTQQVHIMRFSITDK